MCVMHFRETLLKEINITFTNAPVKWSTDLSPVRNKMEDGLVYRRDADKRYEILYKNLPYRYVVNL